MPTTTEKDQIGYKICFVGSQLQNFEECLAEFENLEESSNIDIGSVYYMDISYNCLRNLRGLRIFSHLEVLILDNNELDDHLHLPLLTNLKVLSLNKNNICDLDNFLSRTQIACPFVNHLSLICNPACPTQLSKKNYSEDDYHLYRLKVLRAFPILRFLDSEKITADERNELNQAEMHPRLAKRASGTIFRVETYCSPGEVLLDRSCQKTAKYGKLVRQYVGAQSEGNRFILSEDL
ncbi:leucine-rich melanocyte differentiation-associated protein-like [Paramacrobiotus metropolitanus]|uniref:leucine-rich melanocyte differentiation-associated protein-like n=1 Tax=Paramacrobiotus metropolitanus TaxID=2943436 RepID=UPI00244607BE|nr:leucine-rich melanocyte differentiation-associated protein-like [Paramacrobiotus metropolitanus]